MQSIKLNWLFPITGAKIFKVLEPIDIIFLYLILIQTLQNESHFPGLLIVLVFCFLANLN